MLINKLFDYKPLTRQEIRGIRYYNIPDGTQLPSVTTILSSLKDNSHLQEWIDRVGEVEANKIKTEASTLGTGMHQNLENYILGKPMVGNYMEQGLAKLIVRKGLSNVNEVWGTEVALYSAGLYAGTTDLVGLHNGIPSIMDFKNSLKDKKKEWIEDYFMQLAAYSMAHNEMYGTDITNGVVMIATRDGKYQEFIITGDEFIHYQIMWANKVNQYYENLP